MADTTGTGPSSEQLAALQNRLIELAEEGALGLLQETDLTLISWALGYSRGGAEQGIPSPRQRNRPTSEPALTHCLMHEALDLLLAQYILDNRDALPSETSVIDLLHWSNVRLMREGKLDDLVERAKRRPE